MDRLQFGTVSNGSKKYHDRKSDSPNLNLVRSAIVGDFLDKPTNHRGLALSRPLASAGILALIVVLVFVLAAQAVQSEIDKLAARQAKTGT